MNILTFLKEVQLEIKKVDWPTKKEAVKYTLIVVGVCLAVAIFLGGIDFSFTQMLNKFVF